MSIDQKHLELFTGPLKTILDSELARGNRIRETSHGFGSAPELILILLDKRFGATVPPVDAAIVFRVVNDPHYWQAEYEDKRRKLLLACGF
ncbi:MAG: hypothetical protein E6X17_16935 [Sporomusaceae bacterium]|nr:hypothetical protein [Sporomusaceae bacterium]